jgi:hypothetical protein
VLCVLGLAAVGALYSSLKPRTYEAQSLVVSLQLGTGVTTKALPQLGATLFYSGAVAAQVVADPAVGGDPTTLIPNQVDVIVAQDSVVFTVVGRASDPVQAKRLADLAAAAFVSELNRPGPGVGVFKVQNEARVPTDAQDVIGLPVLVGAGALAGLLLSLGILALIAAVRRPVIEAVDVESTLGTRVLGTVLLPAAPSGKFSGPAGVPGIAPITRWMAGAPSGLLLMVSDARTGPVRQQILVMLAVTLARYRPTSVQGAAPLRDAVEAQRRHAGIDDQKTAGAQKPAGDELVFVDGDDPHALVDPRVPLSVVLVIRQGTSRARLRAAASEHRPGELFGVVIVDVRGRRRTPKADPATLALGDRAIETA